MPSGTSGSGTGTGGTPTPSSPNWFKRNWVGLTAGVIAVVALVAGTKGCNRSADVEERIDTVENNITVLDQRTIALQQNDSIFNARQQNLERRMGNAERDISALKDSINVHREAIDSLGARVDSLEVRVDTIASRQEKCPCINPRAKRPSVKRPTRPNNVPARRDTVVVLVKPETVNAPVQNANGCGDDQNANVVIRGNNNTVTISNNGAPVKPDTTKTVTRTVTANCTATLTVDTYVTRQSYCK